MNSLLKRQLRKYISKDLENHPDLEAFLKVVDRSYNNHDEQFLMLQRAMKISSDELFEANQELKKDTENQKKIISKLNELVISLKGNSISEEKTSLEKTALIDLMGDQTQEIIEINQQREKLMAELSIQNKELSEYAHMVSHDLKSPLRSIDSLTLWLKEDYQELIDDSGKETIRLIRENVEKMDVLISGILDYSTVGKNKRELHDVNLKDLLNDLLSFIDTPNHIHIKIADELPIIKGDRHRLQQLFQNLIVNSLAYNDKENGLVEVGYNEGVFFVRDNGKGIEKPYLDKIFKAFFKLENNQKSIGLGLSIVKKIVVLYQGEIWVESVPKEGTTFYFTLKEER
ncbi:sensor histidine kinase [Wenyingzhuangia sp. IMCC45533]